MQFIEMTGKRFGRLVVTGRSPKRPNLRMAFWNCLCDCGKETSVRGSYLRDGRTRSCGCLRIEGMRDFRSSHEKHGLSGTKEYGVWQLLNYRHRDQVCDEWKSDPRVFVADMGPKPSPKHVLRRLDRKRPYCKDNCTWVLRKETDKNLYEYMGYKLNLYKIEVLSGIHRNTIANNMRRYNCNVTEAVEYAKANQLERKRLKEGVVKSTS